MSYYAKHAEHGTRHFGADVDRAAVEAQGWVFWPHPEGNMPKYRAASEAEVVTLPDPQPVSDAQSRSDAGDPGPVAKRRPGRPKKLQ